MTFEKLKKKKNKQVAQGQQSLTCESTSTVTGQSNWVFHHIWVWWPSWSCDLEILLTSAEELLSGLCFFSAILVHLKNHLTRSGSYNDHWGGVIFDPRGKIGRIYVELHMTMLYIKYTTFVSCCCGEDFFICCHL